MNVANIAEKLNVDFTFPEIEKYDFPMLCVSKFAENFEINLKCNSIRRTHEEINLFVKLIKKQIAKITYMKKEIQFAYFMSLMYFVINHLLPLDYDFLYKIIVYANMNFPQWKNGYFKNQNIMDMMKNKTFNITKNYHNIMINLKKQGFMTTNEIIKSLCAEDERDIILHNLKKYNITPYQTTYPKIYKKNEIERKQKHKQIVDDYFSEKLSIMKMFKFEYDKIKCKNCY